MRIEERDGADERRILIACITTTDFLAKVAGRVGKDPYRSKWSNLIFGFCETYYRAYRSSPGRDIESMFTTWAESSGDKDLFSLVSRFLSSLSEEYERQEEINLAYMLDMGERHFNLVRAEKVKENLTAALERGEADASINAISSFEKVSLSSQSTVDILQDTGLMQGALENKQRVLIKYPGAAGAFFGDELAEDSFVAFMAPPKGRKSYVLLDVAWRAMLQGRRVAYIQVGDLSRDQVLRRFLRRAVYRPLKAKSVQVPMSIQLPIGREKELAIVDWQEKVYTKDVTWNQAVLAFNKLQEKVKGKINLAYYATKSVNANDIRNRLEAWDKEGWISNVVVIDYVGNLAGIDNRMASHEQTAYTWAMLRQISEVRKCLVVTANQTNKEGFKSWVLTRSHFSESKMSLAHVTAFLGINVTDEEAGRGIIRYNYVESREGSFPESKCLYCASCLDVANPCVISVLPQ